MSSWIKAHIQTVYPFSQTILQVFLKPEKYIPYIAGQYLQIRTANHQNFFSIANAPLGNECYELHIRHDADNPSSQELLDTIKNQKTLEIQLPFGRCHLGIFPKKSLIFIAGGTGFSPIKAIIEQLLFNQDARIFECYWGAKEKCDLYLENTLRDWQKHVKNFKHLEVVSGQNSYHLLQNYLHRHPINKHDHQIIISGPFDMVYQYRDELLKAEIPSQNIFSDAFEFEK